MVIKSIAVLGQGQMGSGIIQHAAANGYDVILYGRSPEKVEKAVGKIEKAYGRNVEKGRMTEEDAKAAMGKIKTTSDLNDVASYDIVIEAISEDPDLKKDFFKKLEAICGPDTILATNTSSISISEIATACAKPERFIGMHFFSPVPIMKLVEIIMGEKTSDATYDAVKDLCDGLKKVSVKVIKDTPGFIVNRCLFAFMLEAVHIYEDGVASAADIDLAIKNGLNHPMGPFQMMDLSGLDTFPAVCDSPASLPITNWSAPESVKKLVAEGKFGQKSGEGWYNYQK